MYWIVDGIAFGAGISLIVLTIVYQYAYLCFLGFIWIAIYPIILETIYNCVASLSHKIEYNINPKSNIVYNDDYNLTFCGIQKLHPFDSQKYRNIYNILIERGIINQNSITIPNRIPRSLLIEKVSKFYLLKLCYSIPVALYLQMCPLLVLPNFLLRWRALNPMLTGTEGSILAACVALKRRWAVNLSGGYHHASFNSGQGFCIYPDISLLVHYIRTRIHLTKVMIIDLDAHQGNGYQKDLVYDENTFIVDSYNHYIYPNDVNAKLAIKRDLDIDSTTSDYSYMRSLKIIQKDIKDFEPQFIIYNAGTDILSGDPLGRLNITSQGIVQRDQYIFSLAINSNIPIVMLLSGGYQKINAKIIAKSIQNLITKFN